MTHMLLILFGLQIMFPHNTKMNEQQPNQNSLLPTAPKKMAVRVSVKSKN
jgi:hypothetical protein